MHAGYAKSAILFIVTLVTSPSGELHALSLYALGTIAVIVHHSLSLYRPLMPKMGPGVPMKKPGGGIATRHNKAYIPSEDFVRVGEQNTYTFQ